MKELNRTLNSQDEIHQLTMYPEDYNVRHLPIKETALPEEKQKIFNKLNEKYFTVKTF
jgi:hypothetical protein